MGVWCVSTELHMENWNTAQGNLKSRKTHSEESILDTTEATQVIREN